MTRGHAAYMNYRVLYRTLLTRNLVMVITTTGLHLLTEMLPRENMRSYGQWPFCPPVTSLDNNYSAMPGRTETRLVMLFDSNKASL